MKKIRVLIVDDHSLIRDGLKSLLINETGITVVGSVSNGQQAIDMSQSSHPDVVLMDIRMPEMDGLEALKKIKAADSNIKVILLSMEVNQEHILKGLDYKMSGYLPKDLKKERLIEAIKRVHEGEEYFDPRVSEIIFDKFRHKKIDKKYFLGKSKFVMNFLAIIFLEVIVGLILWLIGL